MTNKRFILKVDKTTFIIDKQENHRIRDMYRACDVLNRLHQENISLDDENAGLLGARIKAQEEWEKCTDKLKEKIVEQQATIEQLRTQLLICQQSKNDNGGFQVWEVPPIPKGMRITFTTSDGEIDE